MADIVLKDRSGKPVEYPGIERVKLNTVDGEQVEFVDPALIPENVETTIDLDFSGGAVEVSPEDGQTFKKVTVPVPANLIPGNIAEGVDIAGIIGTLAAGGGGGNIKIAHGVIQGIGAADLTFEHGLGVKPDFFIMLPSTYGSTNYGDLYVNVYFNALFKEHYGIDYAGCNLRKSSSISLSTNFNGGITDSTVRIGLQTNADIKYLWLAVAGLV